MTDPLTLLEESERICAAATPGEWSVTDLRETHNAIWVDSDSEDPDGTLTHCTVVDMDREDGPRVIWGVEDAEFIAHSRTELPRLNAALRVVLELHRKVPLYAHEDACETPDDQEHRDERHVNSTCGEYYCEDLIEEYTCQECYRVQDLDSLGQSPAYPCSTVKAIEEAMTDDD